MKQVLFILGLPRSGTTLLQRVLHTSPEIETVPESWLLLPFLSFRERGHQKSIYGSRPARTAINAFLGEDQRLEESIFRGVRNYLHSRYPNCRYFCEKTPRNLLYADKLQKWFPDDRYIILNRNPLNVAASIFRTFENGVLNTYKFRVDLELGLEKLVWLNRHLDQALVLRYEDLTDNPGKTLKDSSEFLGLDAPLDPSQVPPRLVGEMGDPSGQFEMASITRRSELDYLAFIDSIYRKRWFLRFLDNIGQDDFELLGYSWQEHRDAIERHSVVKPIGIRDLGHLIARNFLETLTFRILPRRTEEVPEFVQY